MLDEIVLDGFKGQVATYDLSESTLLVGPNGSGKSAVLEAVAYAATGHVPAGRSKQAVATYFGERGGSVRMRGAGHSMSRGIARKKGGAVSETLDGEPGEFGANPVMLRISEFTGMSPEKRREFFLSICGSSSGPIDRDEVVLAIGESFAREVGGRGTPAAALEDWSDLPEDLHPMLQLWGMKRGISEEIQAMLMVVGNAGASEVFSHVVAGAKTRKLQHGASAKKARAAIEELEVGLEGARAASGELKRLEARVEALREAEAAQAQRKAVCAELLLEVSRLREVFDGGILPVEDPGSEDFEGPLKELKSELSSVQGEIAEFEELLGKWDDLLDDHTRKREEMSRISAAISQRESLPIQKLDVLLGEIPLGAHKRLKEARRLSAEVTAHVREQLEDFRSEIDFVGGELQGMEDELDRAARDRGAIEAKQKERREDEAELKAKLDSLVERSVRLVALAKQYSKYRVSFDAGAKIEEVEGRLQELGAEWYPELERHEFPELHAAASRVEEAEISLQSASYTAGKLVAYEDAIEHAERCELLERAWKHVEKSAKSAREVYVEGVTRGVLEDVQTMLEACGRKESAYCTLENARGTPMFELGWARDGQRIPFDSMSEGEAVLFGLAVSLAVASHVDGITPILLEADPLDRGNMKLLLGGLDSIPDGLVDAIVVATSRSDAVDLAPKGWKVLAL